MERRRVQIEKKCIFVGQLDPDMATHGNLERHFSVHGLVESIQIFSSTEHQARNKDKGRMNAWNRPAFAFIRFTDESSAESALRENGKQWGRFALKIQYRETSLSRMRAEHAEYQRHRRWESVQGDTSLTNGPHAHSEEPWSTALDAAPKDGEEEDEFYPSPNYSVTSHEPWPPGQPDMVSMYASEHALGFYDPAFVPAAASRYCGPPEWVKYPAFSTQAVYPVPTILPPVAYPPCYSYRLHPFYGLSIGRGDMAVGAASSQLVRTDSDRPRKTTIPFNYTPYVPSTYPEYI
ncbi:uncharacterized protein BJ171DRAFT_106756 [Polychytrium aggregatum]|uniref:uncharacterized protein n=1 Tax=Polychytrium aggregatum TaxID=110093 RepID=UPI0022FEAE83|nr:uncharacterized protein BJ171DRAFT_106756 [Polychytrium aggregatum]KAI9204432.1 hypothetical protein BJ171DRAFT_106756 [Polychytrium aggregatum]